MLDLKVEIPQSERLSLLRVLDPKAMAFAEAQALNRTGANVSKLGLELVSLDMGISKAKLAKRGRKTDFRDSNQLGGVNPTKKATRTKPFVVISGRGRPFNIKRFGAKAVRGGESFSLKGRKRAGKGRVVGVTHHAWGRQQAITGVWLLKNGAVMVRKGASFRSVYGPGVTNVMAKPKIQRRLTKHASQRFEKHLASAVDYVFSPAYRGRG